MKKKVLLFAIAGIGYAIILLMMGNDMGRKNVERRGHIRRFNRLSNIVGFLDGVRTGDIATAESRLRLLAYVEAAALLNGSWQNDYLISPLAKKLLEIGEAIPSAEKSAAEQKWETRLKRKMQDNGKELLGANEYEKMNGLREVREK